MVQESEESTRPVVLLANLVGISKREGLVRELADALQLRRQTIYLWERTGEGGLSHRAAKLRLLEVSRLARPRLSAVVAMAAQAHAVVEAQEVSDRGAAV